MAFTARPATSLEYVAVNVSSTVAGVRVDPTTDPVFMAFKEDGDYPVSGDFVAASWETNSTTTPTTYTALCLVGPGGTIALTAGTWQVFVKITDNPEVPVLPVHGPLKIK